MKTAFDIRDKVALVTAATRGIGKAIVEAFLDHGARKVYMAVRNPDSAAPLVRQYGEKVAPVQVDLARPETIRAMAESASDVQAVVNNAAIFRTCTPLDTD